MGRGLWSSAIVSLWNFDTVSMSAECWGYLIGHMEDPAVTSKFTAFYVKLYIHFLKYACALVLPFKSSGVLT